MLCMRMGHHAPTPPVLTSNPLHTGRHQTPTATDGPPPHCNNTTDDVTNTQTLTPAPQSHTLQAVPVLLSGDRGRLTRTPTRPHGCDCKHPGIPCIEPGPVSVVRGRSGEHPARQSAARIGPWTPTQPEPQHAHTSERELLMHSIKTQLRDAPREPQSPTFLSCRWPDHHSATTSRHHRPPQQQTQTRNLNANMHDNTHTNTHNSRPQPTDRWCRGRAIV